MKAFYAFLTATIVSMSCFAQITQVVKGKVIDRDAQSTIPGAAVCLYKDSVQIKCVTTNENGFFRLDDIPIGKYKLFVSYLGYKPYKIGRLIVNSGKEVFLTISLEESAVQLQMVDIKANSGSEASNKMALISARSFNVEETERYAGSRNDPARMVSNYAGVRGADDSRNDIIIRGNSPLGLLWQLENIPIPNPNHFAIFGSTGGPVSILNNKTLSNSDFYTGAFPAEYGNALSGAFDLKLRNGNNEKHERTIQLGVIGTEAMLEGPISKKSGSSYLATYRFSSLELFKTAGVNFGVSAIPKFQDATIKLNFPTKKGRVSLFAIGGKSDIYFKDSERDTTTWSFGDAGKDVYFGSSMGVVGGNYLHFLSKKSFLRFTTSVDYSSSYSTHNLVRDTNNYREFIIPYPFLRNRSSQKNVNLKLVYNQKINAKHTLQVGMVQQFMNGHFSDSIYSRTQKAMYERFRVNESSQLSQFYVQWKWKWNDKWQMVSGLHYQYFFLNGDYAVEPRWALRFTPNNLHTFSLAYGMHHQIYPMYVYFGKVYNSENVYGVFNTNIKSTQSQHIVLGYSHYFNEYTSLKLETYYQYLSKIPVYKDSISSFSLINQGTGFNFIRPEYVLINAGIGYNTGVEITLERRFHKKWFYLISASFYDSKYKASDGVWRNTAFNGKYAFNALLAKVFSVGKSRKNLLTTGGKITWAGGTSYTPFDINKSDFFNIYYIDSLAFTKRYRDYFRFDVKITYTINKAKRKSEIGLDLINILNVKNVLTVTFNPFTKETVEEQQLGFLPVVYYRVEF